MRVWVESGTITTQNDDDQSFLSQTIDSNVNEFWCWNWYAIKPTFMVRKVVLMAKLQFIILRKVL